MFWMRVFTCLKGRASESFEAMKDALLSSIVELSQILFNLVLFWNLRKPLL